MMNGNAVSASPSKLCFQLPTLKPRFADITSEYSTNGEQIVVSADALFLEVIAHDYLNWTFGGQTLVICHMMERFLKSLADTVSGTVRLVWFSELANIYTPDLQLSFFYHVARKHFLTSTDCSVVFSSPFSSDWIEFLHESRPPFLFVSDGCEKLSCLPKEEATRLDSCLKSIVFAALDEDVRVAMFAGLQMSLKRLSAFHCMPSIDDSASGPAAELWQEATSEGAARGRETVRSFGGFFDWCEVIRMSKTEGADFEQAARMFILSVVLQHRVSLDARCSQAVSVDDPQSQWIMRVFVPKLLSVGSSLLLADGSVSVSLADVYDGKFFCSVVAHFSQLMTIVRRDGGERMQEYERMCAESDVPSLVSVTEVLEPKAPEVAAPGTTRSAFSIASFNNTLVERYLCASDLPKIGHYERVDDSAQFFGAKVFEEKYHWHNGRLIDDDLSGKAKAALLAKQKSWYVEKQKQKARKFFHTYGESLNSSSRGKPPLALPPIAVVAAEIVAPTGGKKASKPKPPTKKEKMLMDIEEGKQKELEKKEGETVRALLIGAAKYRKEGKYEEAIKALTVEAAKFKCPSSTAKIVVELLELEVQLYVDDPRRASGRASALAVVRALKVLHQRGYESVLGSHDQKRVAKIWQRLGFANGFSSSTITDGEADLSLGMDLYSYQLKHGGELLEIQTNAQPDRRVEFVPDSWQVELLDAVDQSRSALIVVPTSGGKTFVSYYCIERVLREDTDGVVVYVSPTKALVNQVAATIYYRFRNEQTKPGESIFGIFTRDYREDATNCRVLVTVPECLEILLLSPAQQGWVKRLRYAILDEVHCIGGGVGDIKGKEVWEHIILMLGCPIIALSATIGNPESLHAWLQQAETQKCTADTKRKKLREGKDSYTVKFVNFSERFSELELFSFRHDSKEIAKLHPFLSLNLETIAKTNELPSDMHLTAKQAYELFDAMAKVDNTFALTMQPRIFFAQQEWLTRADLRRFEQELKRVFLEWTQASNEKALQVLNGLVSGTTDIISKDRFSNGQLVGNIWKLVSILRSGEMLPALTFSDNRGLCESFAADVCDHLAAEENTFLARPENVQRAHEWARKLANYEKEQRKIRDKAEKEVERAGERERDVDTVGPPTPPFDLSRFSLRPCGLADDKLDAMVSRLLWKDKDGEFTHRFIGWLRRGIGVHHSGLSITKRRAVEMLFRSGHLRLVFSTSTLALGIHMPCKSVVFGCDSMYLTPLQYRQMSGRAGRRGFDQSGNVIFFGVPKQKVVKLLCSPLTSLTGNKPFGVATVLRLLALTAGDSETVDHCLTLLTCPLIVQSAASLRRQLNYYFLFCVQFLRQASFIDSDGHPIGLAGIISHLHYEEPGCIVFAYFLQKGLLHQLCAQYSGTDHGGELSEQILVVLANLFTRMRVADWQLEAKEHGEYHNSKVVLEPLPAQFAAVIQEYNHEVEASFRHFVGVCASTTRAEAAKVSLPFSNVEVSSAVDESIESVLHPRMQSVIQDPIIALCGRRDESVSFLNEYLVNGVDSSISFDSSFLPTIAYPLVDGRGKRVYLNSYALDFWRHGILNAIIEDNGLFENDCFDTLKGFMLAIQAIRVSLEQLAPQHDPVLRAFQEISDGFQERFNKAYNISNSY